MQGATGHDPHGRMRMRNVGQRTHTYTLTLSQGQEVRLHQGVAVDEICARGASTRRQPGTPSPRGISCAPGLLPRLAEHTASTPGGPRRASCARALPAPPRPAPPRPAPPRPATGTTDLRCRGRPPPGSSSSRARPESRGTGTAHAGAQRQAHPAASHARDAAAPARQDARAPFPGPTIGIIMPMCENNMVARDASRSSWKKSHGTSLITGQQRN